MSRQNRKVRPTPWWQHRAVAIATLGVAVAIAGSVVATRVVGSIAATPAAGAACWADDARATAVSEDGVAGKQYSQPPAMKIDPAKTYTGTIQTNFGPIEFELFPEEAPQTVNNFVCLAEDGYYTNTPFHRIVKGFVIQGGDPTGTGMGGPGYKFNDEPIAQNRDYAKGTLAMANAGPNTNGSQFFIVLENLQGSLPKNYTIFGQVTGGQETVDAIAAVRTSRGASGENSTPTEPVTLESITINDQ